MANRNRRAMSDNRITLDNVNGILAELGCAPLSIGKAYGTNRLYNANHSQEIVRGGLTPTELGIALDALETVLRDVAKTLNH